LALHPFGAVVADDADHVAALQPEGTHAEGERLDRLLVIAPTVFQPDAELLFAHGRLMRPVLGVVGQQFGKSVVATDVGMGVGLRHHATVASESSAAASVSPR